MLLKSLCFVLFASTAIAQSPLDDHILGNPAATPPGCADPRIAAGIRIGAINGPLIDNEAHFLHALARKQKITLHMDRRLMLRATVLDRTYAVALDVMNRLRESMAVYEATECGRTTPDEIIVFVQAGSLMDAHDAQMYNATNALVTLDVDGKQYRMTGAANPGAQQIAQNGTAYFESFYNFSVPVKHPRTASVTVRGATSEPLTVAFDPALLIQ